MGTTDSADDPWMSSTEVAAAIGMSRVFVWREAIAGRIEHQSYGKRGVLRFRKSVVDAYIAAAARARAAAEAGGTETAAAPSALAAAPGP